MRQRQTRVLSRMRLLLLCCAMLALLTVSAFADNTDRVYDDLIYRIDDAAGTIRIVGGSDSLANGVVIPEEIEGYTVTEISDYAFQNRTAITQMTLPDTITSIGANAFYGCTNMTKVNIPDGVTTLGDSAFYNCDGLSSIALPASIGSIGTSVFYGCDSLATVTLEQGIMTIGNSAFQACVKLAKITLPDSVTSVGTSAFYGCSALTTVTLSPNMESLRDATFRGCSALTRVVIPDDYTAIGANCFQDCTSLTRATLPANLISIGANAFLNCGSLSSITFPEGTTRIQEYAFRNCGSLSRVTLPGSIDFLGVGVFMNCGSITSLTVEDGVSLLSESMMQGCTGLTRVTLPESINSIGTKTFYGDTGLTKIVLPDGLVIIGQSAFENCTGLANVTFPDSLANVQASAFKGCVGLKAANMPDEVASIGDAAFQNCTGLTSITIPADMTYIRPSTFYGCEALKTVIIQEGVSRIGTDAFRACKGLTSITIPDSVTLIEARAFYGCVGLAQLTLPDSVSTIGDQVFYGCEALRSIVLPEELSIVSAEAFRNCYALQSVTFPADLTTVRSRAFQNCTSLTDIDLPDGVTVLESYAFADCSRLTNARLSNGLSTLNDYLFANCTALTHIEMPETLITIGAYVFSTNSSLKTIELPDTVVTIGNYAFSNTPNLKSIEIPDSVVTIGRWAFSKGGLTGIFLPDSVTAIGDYSFYSCPLESVRLSESLKSISDSAFAYSSLKSVVIPGSVTYIGENAFCYCAALSNVTIPTSVTSFYNGPYGGSFTGSPVRNVYYAGTEEQFKAITGRSGLPANVTIYYNTTGPKYFAITEQPEDVSGYSGTTATISLQTVGDDLSYLWEFSTDGGETWTPASSKIPSISITINDTTNGWLYRCTVSDSFGISVVSDVVSVTMEAHDNTIEILSDPQDYLGAVGDTAKFTVVATGEGLTYRWQYSDNDGQTWLSSSLKSAVYSAKLTADKNGRMVRCIVTDQYGNSLTTGAAKMLVSSLKITGQPANFTGAVGDTAKFTVTASGDGLTYRWEYSDDNGATWLPSSLKTSTYSAKLTADKNGRMVRCVVTDQYGNSAASDAAKMSVSGLKITAQPADYSGAVNSTAKFTVTASGDGLTYQWQYSDDNGKTWLASSLKSATYSAKLTADKNNRMVRCIVTDQYGASATSNAAKMTVASGLKITTQPQDYVGAINSTAKFTVAASGSGLTYKWQYSDDGGKTWLASSVKSATYSAKFTAEKDGRMVRCIVTDANGNSVTSNAAKMATASGPVITAQPQNYVGAAGSTAKFTVAASGSGLTYQWQYSDDNGATWLASSIKSATYSAKFTADKNNRMVRCIVTDASGSAVTSNAASMKIG